MTTQRSTRRRRRCSAGQMVRHPQRRDPGTACSASATAPASSTRWPGCRRPPASRSPRQPDLNERYVREWLGAMVTGRIVEYDPPGRPTACRRARRLAHPRRRPEQPRGFCQYFAARRSVEDRWSIASATAAACPTRPTRASRSCMAEKSGQVYDATLVRHVLPSCPVSWTTWRRASTSPTSAAARATPSTSWPGVPEQPLRRLRLLRGGDRSPAPRQPPRPDQRSFEVKRRRRSSASEPRSTSSPPSTRSTTRPSPPPCSGHRRRAAAGRHLPDGGHPASSNLQENIGHPLGPLLYAFSTMHCMTVSLAQGGEGSGTVWGEQRARELLRRRILQRWSRVSHAGG